MFLNNKYISCNELVQKMNIHIANISILTKDLEDTNIFTKLGNCVFVDKTSIDLPKNIRIGIAQNTFTDCTNILPLSYLIKELEITKAQIINLPFTSQLSLAGKDFIKFEQSFIDKVQDKTTYVLSNKETEECLQEGNIEGSIKLSNSKNLTWY